MDGRIVRCGIISSCQSAATSDTVFCKALVVTSLTHEITVVCMIYPVWLTGPIAVFCRPRRASLFRSREVATSRNTSRHRVMDMRSMSFLSRILNQYVTNHNLKVDYRILSHFQLPPTKESIVTKWTKRIMFKVFARTTSVVEKRFPSLLRIKKIICVLRHFCFLLCFVSLSVAWWTAVRVQCFWRSASSVH